MKKSKIRNIIEGILYAILGAVALAGIGFGCYKLYNSLFKVQIKEVNSKWENLPLGYKEYSTNNSFKIQLHTSKDANSVTISSGTAWSWYWKEHQNNSKLYDWYLITNFHVVNDAIAYSLNLNEKDTNHNVIISESNANKLLESYKNNYKFAFDKYEISLKKWRENNNYIENENYIDILDNLRSYIKELNIIADFQNDNINLFSEKENNNNIINDAQEYNLDMALIKMTFDFTNFTNNNNISYQNNISYPILNYKNSIDKNIKYDKNLKVFIAGNPANKKNLVGVEINSEFRNDEKSLIDIPDLILKKLKAPYLYSKDNYDNFPLSEGASGSPVYQDINYKINGEVNLNLPIDWIKKIPIGIYWGGQTIGIQMKPSFIPFIVNGTLANGVNYNIFDNFINAINDNKL